MNNTIFRRKFVFGVLIALMLGFGVHGTVDALETLAKGIGDNGDVELILPYTTDTHEFDFSLTGIINYQDNDSNDANVNYREGDSIRVSISNGTISRVTVGSAPTDFNPTISDFITLRTRGGAQDNQTFTQREVELSTGSSDVTVLCRANQPGEVTLTVSHVGGSTPRKRTITFVAYGIRPSRDVQNLRIDTTSASTTNSPSKRFSDSEEPMSVRLSGTNQNWVRVTFTSTAGNLSVDWDGDGDPPDAGPAASITTFTRNDGVATVQLAEGTTTGTVTATVPSTNERYVVIFAYQRINLSTTLATIPEDTVNQELTQAFTVTARDGDGSNSANTIPGLEVMFEVVSPTGELVRNDSFETGDTARVNYDANFETNGKVITNDSGEATVNLKFGREPGIYTVRSTEPSSIDVVTFEAKAVAVAYTSATPNAASIEIESGNGQSAPSDRPLADPLVVVVRDLQGLVLSGVPVTFSTDPGRLSFDITKGDYTGASGTSDGANVYANLTPTAGSLTVETDKAGKASVGYNVGNVQRERTVLATITIYGGQERIETFTVNGSGTTQTGNNLSISLSRTTARVGDSVTATVNAGQSGVDVTLISSSGLTLFFDPQTTGSNGSTSFTFTIPSGTASRNYTLNASASGYNADSISLTVQGTQTNVTPSLSPRSISGDPRDVIDVEVRLSGAPSGTRVDIDAPFNVFERTDSSGVASFRLRLPNTAGDSGRANVTALSYTSSVAQLDYEVTGTATGTEVRLELPSGARNQLTEPVGSTVRLRVHVVDNSDNGVSGVEVTFTDNLGRITHTPTDSDPNGEVYADYPVGSSTETFTASITDAGNFTTGSPTSITFRITPGTPTTSTRLSIFQTSTTGAPGAPHALTIDLEDANRNPDPNEDVILRVTNSVGTQIGSSVLLPPTDNTGRARTPDTFRLPDTPGVYTITATSGAQTDFVTVTVFAIRLVKDSSDSVSGDDQEGNRGEVLDDPFVVRVLRDSDSTTVEGVPVTFRVTDGDGELSESSSATSGDSSLTVDSDSSGNARVYLVLDEDQEDNEVTASVVGATDVTFTASGMLVPYDLEIVSGDDQRLAVNQRSAPIIVRVTDEDGNDLEGVTVSFTSRGPAGATLTRSAETDRIGEAEADFVSRSAGTYTITARVTGIPSVTFTITVGDLADSIRIVSGNNQRGDPGTQLSNPLVVEVLDDDGDTVSGVTVTFRVTGGGGSLSATSVSTNSNGRAQTTLTLGDSPGGNSVRASVSGVSGQVTFGATAVDPAPPEPVIHLGAGQRADSYWINTDSGTLHRLVGGSVEDIASGVENVVSLVVTSDRLYWVEDTGNNSGRLRRSNLNGSNIQLIRDLTATPAGITVDTANNKIYMTNAWGKVQAINSDGSGYAPNLITGLSDPKDIAVGSGKVYWITGGGTVLSANVDGSGATQIAGGYDTLGSIAVGGGKVFWTEAISESDGNIHSANLNGTGVTEVVSLLAAPYGISVDTSANKLYFTNSRGRIMQGNLDGSGIQIVASNLVALGDVSVPSGTAAPRPPGTFSQYDVNRDGTVDNTDAALVAAALGESPPSNPRLDVNGDGMVNFLDLLLVFDNRDNTNAAPVALAQNLPNVSREEIQNQIEQLLASDNQSATAQFTLAYLQNLLEVVTPEKTRLLANYPNPFNPETWIPYQLATSSEVQITIYNSAGREVRTLSLGHQSKGYYTDRSSAAYWDGRNVIGEAVSSGVYFYTLTTDRMSATRKMLILK